MPLEPGSRLDAYEIERPLGAGGMGEVWLATEVRLGRKVALKVLPADLTQDTMRVQRFEQEARAASALNHPNVCTILALGQTSDGQHYIAMEYVEGETLRQRLSTTRLTIRESLDVAVQVAAALSAAHSAGIVHRDIKPENVMLRPDGFVKVLDFGLAKLAPVGPKIAGGDTTQTVLKTEAGVVVGTAAYMSPEQARGQDVDARTDVWSMGVMLYEMVASRLPFTGPSGTDVLAAILEREPPPLARFEAEAHPELQRIITKTLRKDRTHRYHTIQDLLLDLQALRDELGQSRPVSSTAVQPEMLGPHAGTSVGSLIASRAPRRRAVLITLAIVIALLAVAIAWTLRPAGSKRDSATEFHIGRMTRLTTEAHAQLAAISGDGRYVVHVKTVNGTPSLWVRQTATASDVQIVAPASIEYLGATFSPDANHIYYVTREGAWGTLFRVPVLGGRPQRVLYDVDSGVGFAPDGAHFVFARHVLSKDRTDSHLMLSTLDGSAVRPLASYRDGREFMRNAAAWSPDGKQILASVIVNSNTELRLIDSQTGAETKVPGQWAVIAGVVWMPDGQSVLLSGAESVGQPLQIWQIAPESGQRRPVTTDLATYFGLSLSHDGTTLATVQYDITARIALVNGNHTTDLTSGRNADGVFGVGWLPDGRVLFDSARSGSVEIWVVQQDGTGLVPLAPGVGGISSMAVGPDGRYVFCTRTVGGTTRIWRIDVGTGEAKPITAGPEQFQPVVSRDGRWIYFTVSEQGVFRTLRVPPDGGDPVAVGDAIRFSLIDILPDGRLLGTTWVQQKDGTLGTMIALLPPDGGAIQPIPDVPFVRHPFIPDTGLGIAGSPDGSGITFVDTSDSVPNLWRRRITGGKAQRVTNFTAEMIFDFAWSKDGKLAVSRGQVQDDVVMIVRR